MLRIFGLVAMARAADVVFAPNLDEYYGTTVDVKCSIDRGMEVRYCFDYTLARILSAVIVRTRHPVIISLSSGSI